MAEKKDKPSELRSRWNKIRRYRWVAYSVPVLVIIDTSLFGVYGMINPLGWLYGVAFAAFLILGIIYTGAR